MAAEHVLTGIAALLWPAFAIAVLYSLRSELKALIASFSQRDFTVEIAGQKLSLTKKIEELDDRVGALQLATLQVVTKGIVTEFEGKLLTGLASPSPFSVDFGWILKRELERLDALRYVEPLREGGMNALDAQNERGKFDLKEYVRITPDGLEYLRLRAAMTELQAKSARGTPSGRIPAP
jgi:hypothetical protein